MTKICWRNIGNLFVICMGQVTKSHLYHLLGVSDYYVMYRQRAKCEMSAKVTNWVTDPFVKSLCLEGEKCDVSPKQSHDVQICS